MFGSWISQERLFRMKDGWVINEIQVEASIAPPREGRSQDYGMWTLS